MIRSTNSVAGDISAGAAPMAASSGLIGIDVPAMLCPTGRDVQGCRLPFHQPFHRRSVYPAGGIAAVKGADMAGWNSDTAAGPVGAGTVTLVEGSCFCISAANGDIHPDLPHGVFHEDTRILSGWSMTVNGSPLEPLTAETKEPYRALFIGR